MPGQQLLDITLIKEKDEMPIGLIFHADKSHFDNHGGLCTTPLLFTLSIFNEQARMSDKFWRPVAYLPDLSHEIFGEGKDSSAEDSLEDEQNCLRLALE